MKLSKVALLSSLLISASSCAFFNDRTVDLGINSMPSGADIVIDGKHYGKTPAILNLEPKKHNIVLTKEGYGSTSFSPEIWWGAIRTDVNGNRASDGTRCFFDMMTVIFSFNAYNSSKCGDFKEKQHM
ncbi:MAG: PEGA domain-containing protein, partial [Pelagibacterales bacterium]|nr:PEGA domain-containing protein [Pelagibacterales bacterium]